MSQELNWDTSRIDSLQLLFWVKLRIVLNINKRGFSFNLQYFAKLEKVASKSNKNMMTVGNLGVCFGPTLLRDEEETVAAIMDIKFANVVVEILIENWRQILLGKSES